MALGLGVPTHFDCVSRAVDGPGDVRLRHDLQQLSDRGLLSGPALSWPIGWSQVARELGKLDTAALSVGEQASVERLRARAAREMRTGDASLVATLSGAVDPTQLRTLRVDAARGRRGDTVRRLARPALRLEAVRDRGG